MYPVLFLKHRHRILWILLLIIMLFLLLALAAARFEKMEPRDPGSDAETTIWKILIQEGKQ